MESTLVVEGVNWDQAGLYLALTLTRDKVDELNLQEVIPTWKKAGGRGRHPGINTKEVRAPLQEEKDWEKSLFFPPARRATEQERKVIFSLCVEQGLLAAMENHLYVWHKEVKLQVDGLGIFSFISWHWSRLDQGGSEVGDARLGLQVLAAGGGHQDDSIHVQQVRRRYNKWHEGFGTWNEMG